MITSHMTLNYDHTYFQEHTFHILSYFGQTLQAGEIRAGKWQLGVRHRYKQQGKWRCEKKRANSPSEIDRSQGEELREVEEEGGNR